jgi:hypothetical protein
MSNIRTVNKRHKRAIVANISRNKAAETGAAETPSRDIGEPVKAVI